MYFVNQGGRVLSPMFDTIAEAKAYAETAIHIRGFYTISSMVVR